MSALIPYDEELKAQLAAMPDGPKPFDVDCPKCGAKIGFGCTATSGYGAKTHMARWKAVGVERPDHEDRHRSYLDGVLRELERKSRNLEGLHAKMIGNSAP